MDNIFNWLTTNNNWLIPALTFIGLYIGYLIPKLPGNIQKIINKIGGLEQFIELIKSCSKSTITNEEKKQKVLTEITRLFNAYDIKISQSAIEFIFNLAYNSYKLKKKK